MEIVIGISLCLQVLLLAGFAFLRTEQENYETRFLDALYEQHERLEKQRRRLAGARRSLRHVKEEVAAMQPTFKIMRRYASDLPAQATEATGR